ncbi:MAG TPA: S53 family peptidase [Isosphaeraceae bacterium]
MASESFSKWVGLPGSEKAPAPGASVGEATPGDETFDVSIRVRRRTPLPPGPPKPGRRMSHAEYEAKHGADPDDVKVVERFATHFGLAVKSVLPAERTVILEGTAAAFSRAFKVELRTHRLPDETWYRGRQGTISIPDELRGIVVGVFGLDDRQVVWPMFRRGPLRREMAAMKADAMATPDARFQTPGAVTAFFPNELADMYNFPPNTDGTGQTVGIVELGGGFRQQDLDAYFKKAGVHNPPTISVAKVPGGATNKPAPNDPEMPDVEVLLDMEVVGSAAPGAKMVMYFIKDGSDQQCLLGVTTAVHDAAAKNTILSLSWGGPEFEPGSVGGQAARLQKQFQDNLNDAFQAAAHLGITVCVASGDNGSACLPLDDPQRPWDKHAHVSFPASSPFALACGGTHVINSSGPKEESWHPEANVGTGGGISRYFPMPAYQDGVVKQDAVNPKGGPGRGVPDVAADAAQESGYRVLVDGQWFPDPNASPDPMPPIGGTSASAPLWAALIARINQAIGTNVGFVNPMLYQIKASSKAFQDITLGNNGDYKTAAGWDPCTGLGTPDGKALLAALRPLVGSTATPTAAPTPVAAKA